MDFQQRNKKKLIWQQWYNEYAITLFAQYSIIYLEWIFNKNK